MVYPSRDSPMPLTLGSFEVQPPQEPVIEWSDPDNIFVGTGLSDIQLNATTNTAGTFTYTPDSGTILNLGDSQTLIVQFTPDDSVNYATTFASAVYQCGRTIGSRRRTRFLRDLAVE